MIIESPEALKEWLTNVLEPMCEADPTALAKYVIALVKKDKPIADIRETCIDQLDVFLQKETKPFVELLFKTLDNRSYLSGTDVPSTAVQQTPVTQVDPSPAVAAVSNNVVPNVISSIPTGASGAKLPERRTSHPDSVIDSEERDRENKQPGLIKGSTSSHNRSRSRSRSRNKSRSRSRDREDRRSRRLHGEGERRRRGDGRRHDRYISYRRDRSRDRIDRDRERERDRERDRDRKRSRSRSMSRSKSRSKSRSRSRSKDKSRQRLDSQKLQNSASGSQDHGDTDYRFGVPPPPALGSLAPSQNSSGIVTSIPPPSGPLDGQPPFPGRNARRCRDYDEKGFCMRGDLCPYDHGADPVVVEEAHLPSMLAYGSGNTNTPPQIPPGPGPGPRPPGPPPPGPIPPLLGPPLSHPRPLLPQPPLSMLQPPGSRLFPPMSDPYIPEPYNPEAPAMDRLPPRVRPPFWGPRLGPGRGHGMRPQPQYPHPTRELINVPTVDNTSVTDNSSTNNSRTVVLPQKRPLDEPQGPPPPLRIFRNVDNTPANKVPLNRRIFDYNRLGNRKFNFENAVLELRKIPQGLNSITQLNNHFGRFGKIVNLQVCYEGDPEAALIQFSSHAEAHAAYRSTEAVLNNRFIKVFWHNKDGGLPAKSDNNVPVVKKLPAKERLGLPLTRSTSNEANSTTPPEDVEKSSVTLATSGTLSKTVFNVAAMKKSNVSVNSQSVPTTPLKSHQAVVAKETIKKKQEEQRKEAMKINVDLQKRQQELIQKQIQQQKILIEKLEKNKNLSMAEKASIMTTLKMLQESIEKLKVELVASATLQASHPKTKQEAQKEILDIEMELYARQHQGGDTTELQKKVADLKQEALALGLIDSKFPLGRGRSTIRRVMRGAGSAFRGRGRGGGGGGGSVRSVDHRPRALQVTGFEDGEKEEVMAHLSNYGEMENVDVDESGSKLVVTYRNRREAEAAVQQGSKFKGRLLVMVWHQISGGLGANDGHDGLADGLTGEEELLEHETENEDLLLGDDDEEEDSEARSWRR